MRAHFIFEKFTEDSDPIQDMGIGSIALCKKWKEKIGRYNEDSFKKEFYPHVPFAYENHSIGMAVFVTIKNISEKMQPQKAFEDACQINYKGENYKKQRELIAEILEKHFGIKVDPNYEKDINEKFTEDSDPIQDLGIGITHKITSEALFYLYDPSNEVEEIEKNDPDLGLLIRAAQDLEAEGIIKLGKYFDWTEDEEMWKYIYKYKKGRFVYNGTPDTDGVLVVFSKIELPSAERIE
jgi:hypothetical protein